MKTFYKIAPGQEVYRDDLLRLKDDFPTLGERLYIGRNELKKFLWNGNPIVVKSFKVPNFFRKYIYGCLRTSKAHRSFINAIELIRRSVQTPKPIGFVEYRNSGALTQSYYAYHEWSATATLRDALKNRSLLERQELLRKFGHFVWELHSKSIMHRDLSPGNILINGDFFCLIDVNRLKIGQNTFRKRMRNFAMLWFSDPDLEIVLDSYTTHSKDPKLQSVKLALRYSELHKKRALRKERVKTLMNLH